MGRTDPGEQLEAHLAEIEALPVEELRAAWGATFGSSPPARASRRLLLLSLGHRIQAEALGGLPTRAQRRLERVAAGGLRPKRPAITVKPGAALIRDWRGETYRVEILADGVFEWQGQRWRSLSKIAREITGSSRNDPAFFGLREGGANGAA